MEIYEVNFRMQLEYMKMQTRETPNMNTLPTKKVMVHKNNEDFKLPKKLDWGKRLKNTVIFEKIHILNQQ